MLKRLYKDCFLLNLKDYANIGVDFYLNIFLLFAFVALGAAFFAINRRRSHMSLMIKQLIRHGAEGEENAKTLSELGLGEYRGLKRQLCRENQLTKIVSRVGAVKYSYEEYVKLQKEKKLGSEEIDFETARFFIGEDEKKRADNVYENYSGSVPRTVLYCVMLLALYICCLLVMPEAVRLVDKFIGSLK